MLFMMSLPSGIQYARYAVSCAALSAKKKATVPRGRALRAQAAGG